MRFETATSMVSVEDIKCLDNLSNPSVMFGYECFDLESQDKGIATDF